MPRDKKNIWKSRIVGHDRVAPDQLTANPFNHRKHPQKQRDVVNASIAELGFIRSVTVNRTTGNVVDGHERIWQALQSEQPLIDVEYVEMSEEDERKALVILDKSAELAEVDPEALDQLLREVSTGSEELQELFAEMAKDAGLYILPEPQENDIPEPPADPITKPGDLWLLGDHRLLCGDSTKADDVARVMGQERAELCFTSPPYAEQRKEQYGGTPSNKYWDWFIDVQNQIRSAIAETGTFVLNIKPHAKDKQRSLYVADLVCAMVRDESWLLIDEFCWLRNGIPQQVVNRFKNAFEPCYWFAASPDYEWNPRGAMHASDNVPLALGPGAGDTNAARRQGTGVNCVADNDIVAGMAYPSNVLDFKQNAEAIGHPAAFPLQLPSFFLKCMTRERGIVYDPFLGSGTTLIAAEQLGRKCYGMEISPAYCDVIVNRWENFTKQEARLG